MAEIVDGLPQLTPYGEKRYVVLEFGDGVAPELNDLAAMEDQQLLAVRPVDLCELAFE
jgi:hypothetical protein